jgi:hypothetical protein
MMNNQLNNQHLKQAYLFPDIQKQGLGRNSNQIA